MASKILALGVFLIAELRALPLEQTREWVEFAPPGGNCFVKLPTKPADKAETVDSDHGKYTTHLFRSQSDVATYILGWVDYAPDYHPGKLAELEANRDNLLKNTESKLISNRKITLNQNEGARKLSLVHPGIEFTAESTSQTFKARVYMVGDRPYMLVATWAKLNDEPSGVALFFSSFRLAAKQSAVPAASTHSWVEVSLPGGTCSVKMPTQPTESSHSLTGKHGKYVERIFVSSTNMGTYIVTRADYASNHHPGVQDMFDDNRDEFLKDNKATLTSERRITIAGHPGIELLAENKSWMYKLKSYIVGERPYQLMTFWTKGKEQPPGVAEFLSSFRVDKRGSRNAH